ncbi:MAG: SatD family protein [Candidatus Aureabacteria bacterium]|nr:SatD family protein [Candidatus Auribacterota bacterium]
MKNKPIAVITADIVGSTSHSAKNRELLGRLVQRVLRQVNFAYGKELIVPITVTVGDEFQGVVFPHWRALSVADRLRGLMYCIDKRLAVELYVSIGIACGIIRKGKESRMQEGPAFYLSRQGIDALKKSKSRTTKLLIQAEDINEGIDLILNYQDMILSSWTPAQWQAILMRDRGLSLKHIGRKLGVAYQNVQKRLKAANWECYTRGRSYLEDLLSNTPLKG